MANLNFKSTKEIKIPKNIIDQVMGQDDAVEVIKKAANQRRHVLLIGEPGTGKSMLGLGLAELLPKEKLVDVISFPNPNDENKPLIRTMPAGKGRDLITKSKIRSLSSFKNQNLIMFILVIIAMIAPWWAFFHYGDPGNTIEPFFGATKEVIMGSPTLGGMMFLAFFVGGLIFLAAFVIFINLNKRMGGEKALSPKLIVDNFSQKKAPFYDATGAHAGALLGDVLHDPFQCFFPSVEISTVDNNFNKNINIKCQLDKLFDKKREVIKKKERNYEAIFLNKNELCVLGENHGSISPVEVLSSNRHDYNGKMIKLITSSDKEIIVTPKHRIATKKNGKIVYVEAEKLKKGAEILSKSEDIISDEQEIINTYDEKQQEQCRLYYQYLDIKSKNPEWGYKRIAKAMNQPIGKTRWWHAKKHIPIPIQTTQWLNKRGLLPLKSDNPKVPMIAKILGSTFGDGGIFENLNGLFLSSSEKESVKEFGRDLENIFGLDSNENSRIIEGGEYGHSWCYQNTNRNIIRFFLALGAPKGNKTNIDLGVPNWIYLSETFSEEFFGSFLGSELGVPKVHKQKNRLQTLDIGITGSKEYEENRLDFLNKVKRYFDYKRIETTSLLKRKTNNEKLSLYRLMISIKFDNVVRFVKNIKINYCRHKKEKLIKAINEFRELKKKKYEELISRGYGAEHAMKVLQLTPQSMYIILNEERIES